jgi:Sulfatase
MKALSKRLLAASVPIALAAAVAGVSAASAQEKPNIVFIMGDDIGWSNIGVYNQGIMAGRTPNLDRLAAEGMRFTDYEGGHALLDRPAAGRVRRRLRTRHPAVRRLCRVRSR